MTKRQKKKSRSAGTPRRKKAPVRKSDAVLDIVRAGVERFILHDAPIGSFQKTARAAAREGRQSSHPLTASVFRKIVRDAVRERRRRIERALRNQLESHVERLI